MGRGLLTPNLESYLQEAVAYGCDRIAFEELTDIRDRMPGAKKFHAWAFRRLYDYTGYKAQAKGIETTQVDPGVHVQAVFEVRDDTGRESSVASEVLLPEVRLQGQCRLQRGEEHRISATPRGAKVSARRGDTSPRPEVRDTEREWRLLACHSVGSARTGVHRQAHPVRGGLVTVLSLSSILTVDP
ncbi:IS1341-type transposase [Natronococcus jeotgali DSM 18795]|uniref:IS1341-type transposase n=1 Tax=Natronococcus jeotgali DSM 18795 TaxID=1227498 RepID=L9XIT9_9EURY|nr:IS1341-type transposase [Natronococcus jeotgali DSM 18795]